MQTPEWIKPGAVCRTAIGKKARIYATDGFGNSVHGAILYEDGWWHHCWGPSGLAGKTDTLVGPWIEKPIVDWSKLPAWANWVAMDENVGWFWYAEKPRLNQYHTEWIPTGPYCDQIPTEYTPTFTGDWKDSLVERPK